MAGPGGGHPAYGPGEEATRAGPLLTLALLGAAVGCAAGGRPVPPEGPAAEAATAEPDRALEALKPGSYEPFAPPTRPASPVPTAATALQTPQAAAESAYAIQVAAFADPESASDLVFLLRRRYPDHPSRVVHRAGLYRVWLGGWASREEAASVLLIVRQRYADAWIVGP